MAPGKHYRDGVTLIELLDMFPDEAAASKWFEGIFWPSGRCCGKCGSQRTKEVPNAKPMPYWCSDCRSYFSVKTGTALARSKVPLRKWALAIYLCLTSLKGVSSMKLQRDIGVSQPTAWFMLHRIRQAWADVSDGGFAGPVEADETYFGDKRANMTRAKRSKLSGRGSVGKTAVTGVKDRATKAVRARVVRKTDANTLRGFIAKHTFSGAKVYTDDAKTYASLPFDHETTNHSVGEYVDGMVHTNGIESFWSMLKRSYIGTFHKISPKHLDRYIQEFAAKHNMRESDTLTQMRLTVASLVGRSLLLRDLTVDNGLSSSARL